MTVMGTGTGVQLVLHVRAGASRTTLAGTHGDALAVRLAAPPVDGKANRLLLEFLAETLGVRRQAVRLVAGASSRRKIVAVDGVDVAKATRLLLALDGPAGVDRE